MSRSSSMAMIAMACSLFLAAPVLAAGTPEQKCASSKMKAAAKKLSARGKCYSKALGTGEPIDAECLSKADGKFATAFENAEEKGGCLVSGDAAGIGTKINVVVADISTDLTCSNEALDPSEACDDGNLLAGDGCDASCDVEDGYACGGEPSVCGPVCGDGFVIVPEGCDDGNIVNGDGCSSACLAEQFYFCVGEPSVCTPICVLEGGLCDVHDDCCSEYCFITTCVSPP